MEMASVLCVGPSISIKCKPMMMVASCCSYCNRGVGSLHSPARQCLHTSCLLLSHLLLVNQGSSVFSLFWVIVHYTSKQKEKLIVHYTSCSFISFAIMLLGLLHKNVWFIFSLWLFQFCFHSWQKHWLRFIELWPNAEVSIAASLAKLTSC